MAGRNVWVLVISAGMISLDGMLASWIMGSRFQHAEIRQKSSIKSFTINADAAQTEMTILASALDVTKGVSNTPKTQIIPNIPGTASVNVMSGSSAVSRASSIAIAEPSQPTGTTRFAPTIIATANIRSATPIPEPVTDRATNIITSKLRTSKITPENKATTKTRPDITFSKAAVLTETKVHLTEGQPGPSTIRKTLETSKKHTVGPQKSFQAIKTSKGPSINEASGTNLITMIQTATRKQDRRVGKELSTAGTGVTIKSNVLTTIKSTINDLNSVSPKRQTAKVIDKLTTQTHKSVSPYTGKYQTKSTTKNNPGRQGQVKKPMSYDKTFYSAIIMGSILLICGLLALVVFIKDFTGPK